MYGIPETMVLVPRAVVPAELMETLVKPNPLIELPLALSKLSTLPLGALKL